MLSIRELVVLGIIIVVVWYGHRILTRVQTTRARRQADAQSKKAADATPQLDLTPCRVCGAYVAEPATGRCDRPDCPR